jgi:hypothetical protein
VQKRKQSNRKFHIIRAVVVALLAVLVGGGVALAAYVANINSKITRRVDSNLLNVLTETKVTEPFYMLLLGIDRDEERLNDEE